MPIASARARIPSNATLSRATSVKCSIEWLSIFSLRFFTDKDRGDRSQS